MQCSCEWRVPCTGLSFPLSAQGLPDCWADSSARRNGSNYELLQSSTSSSEVTLSGEKTSSISDYINDGNVTVLVKQKSASNGDDASTLATDYVKFVVTHHHAN